MTTSSNGQGRHACGLGLWRRLLLGAALGLGVFGSGPFAMQVSSAADGDRGQPMQSEMESGTARLGDWDIRFASGGTGRTALVFVHGWGADRSSWGTLLEDLDFDGRVVAVDLLGHGASDKPEVPYTLDVLADSVLAVMNALELPAAVLVGHSAGVAVCRTILTKEPERVRGVVALDGALRNVVSEAMAQAMLERMRGPDYRSMLEQMHMYVKPRGELTREQVDAIVAATLATPHHVLLSTFEEQQDPDAWSTESIDVPLLALYADNKMWSMWDDAYEAFVRGLGSEVDYRTWEGVSHLLHLERASEFRELLLDFEGRIRAGSVDGKGDATRFEVRTGFWNNLHHVLWAHAFAKRNERAPWWGGIESLSNDQRDSLEYVAARYRERYAGRSLLGDVELLEIDAALSALGDDDVGQLAGRWPELVRDLTSVVPGFRASIWPVLHAPLEALHDHLHALLEAHHASFDSLEGLFGASYPEESTVVDVLAYANWAGAYTSVDPGHVRIGLADELANSHAPLELLLHEVSHLLVGPRVGTIATELEAAFASVGRRVPPDLWHVILFVNSGELVRGIARAEGRDYVPYAVRHGLYAREPWATLAEPVQRHWPAVSRGETSRSDGLAAIAADLRDEKTVDASASLAPLLLVEAIEPCLPFWIDGLGFTDAQRSVGPDGLDFVDLRRGAARVLLQSRAALRRDPNAPDIDGRPFTKDGTVLYFELDGALAAMQGRLAGYPVVVPRRTMPYGREEMGFLAPGGIAVVVAVPAGPIASETKRG